MAKMPKELGGKEMTDNKKKPVKVIEDTGSQDSSSGNESETCLGNIPAIANFMKKYDCSFYDYDDADPMDPDELVALDSSDNNE